MADLKIECPKCGWEPDGGAYWMCDNCRHIWNTFDTMARCPACGHQHERTACIPSRGGCPAYEPHLDWYKNLDDILDEEIRSIETPIRLPSAQLRSIPVPIPVVIAETTESEIDDADGAAEVFVVQPRQHIDAIHPSVATGEANSKPIRQVEFDTQFRSQGKVLIFKFRIAVIAQLRLAPADAHTAVQMHRPQVIVRIAQPEATVPVTDVVIYAVQFHLRIIGAHAIAAEEEIVDNQCAAATDIRADFAVDRADLQDRAAECAANVKFVEKRFLLGGELKGRE